MLKFKRIAAMIMALSICSTTFGAFTFATNAATSEASIVWTAVDPIKTNVDLQFGPEGEWFHEIVEKNGKYGCYVYDGGNRTEKSGIYVNIADSFVNVVTGYQLYEIKVEYFDEGNSRFRIKYDGLPELFGVNYDPSMIRKTEVVHLQDTKEWKTHTFLVQNPRFGNGWKGYDFSINLYDEAMGFGEKGLGVTFGKITVNPVNKTGLVQGNMSTTEIGNNFFRGDNAKINVELKNFAKVAKKVNVDFVSVDSEGVEDYKTNFDIEIPAETKIEKVFDFLPKKYQIYTGYLTITSDDGIYNYSTIGYSYIHGTDKKNPKLATVNHYIDLRFARDPDYIIPLMGKTGFYANREGYERNDTYTHKYEGTLGITPRLQRVLELEEEYGIKWMPITAYEVYDSPYAGVDRYDPYYYNNWLEYVDQLSTKFDVPWIEIMNECNLKLQPADWYAEASTKAYEIIKENNPNIKVVTGVTSYVDLAWLRTYFENLEYQAFDEISVHPYTFTTAPDEIFTNGHDYTTIIESLRELMAEFGYEDVPLNITEVGFDTANHTKDEQAAYLTQLYAIYQIPEFKISTTFVYDFIADGTNPDDLESNLGIVNHWKVVDNPLLARPALLAMSWLNHTMTDATFKEEVEDDKIHAFHFDSATENQDIIMAWAKPDIGCDNVNFILKNCTDAKVYDMLGNEIDFIHDGTSYSVELNYKPIYIIGNFDEFDVGQPKLSLNRTSFELRDGDVAELVLSKNLSENVSYTFTLDKESQAKIISDSGFVGNTATIKIGTDAFSRSTEGRLVVTGEKSGKILDAVIKMTPAEVATISFKTEMAGANLSRWKGVLTIRNNKESESFSGTAKFLAPDEYAQKIKPIEIPEVMPGESKDIEFNLPEADYGFAFDATVEVTLDDGKVYTITPTIDASVATYAHTKPTIDGIIEEGEWSNEMHLKLLERNQEAPHPDRGSFDGLEDKWADMVLEWDENYFYAMIKDYDDVFYQDKTNANIWEHDSVQMGLSYGAILDPNYKGQTQLGFAYTKTGPFTCAWAMEDNLDTMDEELEYAITRETGCTTYEIKIPWKGYVNKEAKIEKDSYIRFNVIINDDDGNGRVGWVQYSAGIGYTMDSSLFGRIKLIDTKQD